MKDALGHGSDPRGAHSAGVDMIGKPGQWSGRGPATFKVQGTWSDLTNTGKGDKFPSSIRVTADTATAEQAEQLAAQFPKSAKVSAETVDELKDGEYVRTGHVAQRVNLNPDENKGTTNETGLKRYEAFRKAAEKLGHNVVYEPGSASNAYPTEHELNTAIGRRK